MEFEGTTGKGSSVDSTYLYVLPGVQAGSVLTMGKAKSPNGSFLSVNSVPRDSSRRHTLRAGPGRETRPRPPKLPDRSCSRVSRTVTGHRDGGKGLSPRSPVGPSDPGPGGRRERSISVGLSPAYTHPSTPRTSTPTTASPSLAVTPNHAHAFAPVFTSK